MNGKDWFLMGKKLYEEGKPDEALTALYEAVKAEDTWYVDRLNAFILLYHLHKMERNDAEAFKYLFMAAATTTTPRADVCSFLGDEYYHRKEYQWAEIWFRQAVNKIPEGSEAEGIDSSYYTWYPILSLGTVYFQLEMMDKALECFEAVLTIDPNNELAKNNIEYIKSQAS